MHASRDQNGKILALCVHFQAQSGDSGCMARESCHQGPLFASRARKSYMTRRCCHRCLTFRGTSSRVAGPRTGRTGFAPCSSGLVRLPHARVSVISSAPPPLRCPCPRTPPAPIAPPAGPPAPHRPAARAPPRFPQFPRNSAVIQLPIQENSVSKDKQ